MSDDFPSTSPEPRRFFRLALVLVLVAFGGLALALMMRSSPASSDIGKPFPELRVEGWLNGPAPDPAELSGKVRVFEVWAFWCGPCLAAAPHLIGLQQKYAPRGVEFIGLTEENSSTLDASIKFLEQGKITWRNGYGAGPTLGTLNFRGIPMAWVVDREGKIVWTGHPLALPEKLLDDLLQ